MYVYTPYAYAVLIRNIMHNYWGEPERVPHKRYRYLPTIYIYMYISLSYVRHRPALYCVCNTDNHFHIILTIIPTYMYIVCSPRVPTLRMRRSVFALGIQLQEAVRVQEMNLRRPQLTGSREEQKELFIALRKRRATDRLFC